MWVLNHKEGRMPKNWCFQTMLLEKILENPLVSKELKPVNPKGNQSWIVIGRTDAEVEAPILWAPDVKSGLIGKKPDAGKDWRQEEKGMTEDEMIRCYHRLNGHESEQTPGDNEEQGSLACCSPKSWTRLSNWTIASSDSFLFSYFLVPCKNYHSVHLLLPLVQLTFSLLIFWTVYVELFIFISLVVQISFVWFETNYSIFFLLKFLFFLILFYF